MRTPTDWQKALEENGLGPFVPLFLKHWQPCLQLRLKLAGQYDYLNEEFHDETEIGSSKLFGLPDVPLSFVWPTFEDSETGEEVALPFLAQIDLQEIANLDPENTLPHAGHLLFFFDFTLNYAAWELFHIPSSQESLHRLSPPISLPEFATESTYCLNFARSNSLPSIYATEIEAPFKRIAEENGIEKEKELFPLMDTYQLLRSGNGETPAHQLLGHEAVGFGRRYASEWWQECNSEIGQTAKNIKEASEEWRLLLQIDSEMDIGLTVGSGCGFFAFFIRDEDLKAKNFDNVYAGYVK